MSAGTVYWITGLAGAGKSSVGRELAGMLRAQGRSVLFLDGDVLREVFGNDLGHSRDERLKSAMRNARLCKTLADQGIDVVCATISMLHDCQRWNRTHIPVYREIFLKVPMEVLVRRDQKKLYSRALAGEIKDVVGVDLKAEEPERPDAVVLNDGSRQAAEIATDLMQSLSPKGVSK